MRRHIDLSRRQPEQVMCLDQLKALVIMVAESIVTFGPIDQFGWRSAWSTVAARIASSGQVRRPPEPSE